MKIICKFDNLVGVTNGKTYDADDTTDDRCPLHFLIKDDSGRYCWWSKDFFNNISDIRDQKIDEILK